MKNHRFYDIRELFAVFNLRSIFDAIFVPTWLHFGRILDVLGGSGRVLGPLGGVLGLSWGILAAYVSGSQRISLPQVLPESRLAAAGGSYGAFLLT